MENDNYVRYYNQFMRAIRNLEDLLGFEFHLEILNIW